MVSGLNLPSLVFYVNVIGHQCYCYKRGRFHTIIGMCFDQVGIYIHALGNRRPGTEKDQGENFNAFGCITDRALLNQRH